MRRQYEIYVNEAQDGTGDWKLVKETDNGTHALQTAESFREKGKEVKVLQWGKQVKI